MRIYKIQIAKKEVVHDKKQIGSSHGHPIFLVSEEEIRNKKLEDEEFTNFAIHSQFPSLIPDGEIWIGREVSEDERHFFIENAIKQYVALDNGDSADTAYNKALKYEKSLREKMSGIKSNPHKKNKKAPEEVYLRKYGIIHGIEVWIVDGETVRDLYKTDYVEGGHGYVYSWIPNDEIWIEKDLNEDEIPYILHHEYVELCLMRDGDMDYEKAHEIASKKEHEMRKESEN